MDITPTGSAVQAPIRTATPAPGSASTASKAAPVAGPGGTAEANKAADSSELKDVKQAVSEINKAMQFMSRELEFSVDTDSDRTIVKVIDQQTREVIRQMPTKEALEIGKALEKAQGLLIKQTA